MYLKSYFGAFSTTQRSVSLEFDNSPLNMIEITWEQVDKTDLGPNSYLWLKNKPKIHILINTPCVEKLDYKQEIE